MSAVSNLKKAAKALGEVRPSAVEELFKEAAASKNSLGMFSKAEDLILQKMGNKATPEQVRAILKEAKPEEVEYTGLEKLLSGKVAPKSKMDALPKLGDGSPDPQAVADAVDAGTIGGAPDKLLKDDVLDLLRRNQPKLKEITLGDNVIPEPSSKKLAFQEEPDQFFRNVKGRNGTVYKEVKSWPVEGEVFKGYSVEQQGPGKFVIGNSIGTISDELGTFKTKKAAMDHLYKIADERIAQEAKRTVAPKYKKYALEGGSNYKESLIQNTDPEFTRKQYKSGHWDKPDILAHVRSQEFNDVEGKKLFNVEEIQSDWHQDGRKKGYESDAKAAKKLVDDLEKEAKDTAELLNKELANAPDFFESLMDPNYKETPRSQLSKKLEELAPKIREARSEYAALTSPGNKLIPDAPFKKTWHELGLKKALKDAVDSGSDRMSWTPGAEQADRYSLAKSIGEVHYSGTNLKAYDLDGNTVLEKTGVSESDLDSYIGKEAAQKLLSAPKKGTLRSLVGQELKVGGEGMKGFYDQMIPSYLKKLSKQYDAPMGVTKVKSGDRIVELPYIEISPKLREQIKNKGLPLFATAGAISLGASGEAEAGESMSPKKKPSWDDLPPEADAPQAAAAWDAAPPTREELDPSLMGKLKSAGAYTLGKVAEGAEWFDARTGAPARKAIGVLQDDFTDLSGAASAAKAQFGAPTALAPTGKQLALKAGVPTTALSDVIPSLYGTPEPNTGDPELDAKIKQFRSSMPSIELTKGGFLDPTAAGVAGLGLDITADPTNVIPVGAIAKGITKGVKGGITGTKELASFIRSMGKAAPVAEDAVKLVNVEGGFTKAAVQSVKDTAQEIKKLVTPGVSPRWEANRAIAVKNGIDPDILAGGALEFGPTSLITRSKQKLAQGIGGETFRARHMQGLGKVYEATNNVVKKIGDGIAPLAKIDAGEVLATEYKLASKEFFDKMDITYNTVLSQLPVNAPVPKGAIKSYREALTPVIDKLAQRSKNKFLNPTVRAQAQALATDLKKASKANGTMQELRQGMIQLKDAFENSGLAKDMPLETRVLRDLYGKTSKAYIDGTREYLGNEVAEALLANNKSMTEWFKTTERLDDLISSGKPGEEIFRKAIENADSNMLKDLKLVFADKPGVLKRAKAAFVDSLMKVDEDGIFSFARFNNKVRDPKTAMVLSQLFEPQEIKDLLELTKMGENMGPQILNPSKTAEFMGLDLTPKNIASEAAQRGIVSVMEQQARGRGVLTPPVAAAPKPGGMAKDFVDNLKYGAAFSAGAEGLGSALQDPKAVAAKEVLRQTGRAMNEEQDIDVPEDYKVQLEKDVMGQGRMSNTQKAQLIYRMKKEGKISSSVLKQMHGEY